MQKSEELKNEILTVKNESSKKEAYLK